MSYTAISDFKYGMDRRRPQTSGVPGTLWLLRNAVLTRGGDIERAKKFDPVYNLPAGTFGLFSVRGQRFVFGDGAAPAGMPVGVRYQQLAAPDAPIMESVLDAKGYDGKIYAIASYDDGNLYHFYDGARVTGWDTLADAAATYETVAARLADLIDAETAYKAEAYGDTIEITAAVAGTPYTISTTATDNGTAGSAPTATDTEVQANVAAVAEVRATGGVGITAGTESAGVNRITSLTVDGAEILADPVDFIDSNDATANALSVAINDNAHTSGYVASAAGAVVTIQAAVGTGATPNGYVVATTVAGDVTTTNTAMAGGVTAVSAVAQVHTVQIGATTLDSTDLWTITLDGADFKTTGRASATGTAAYVNKSRVFSVAGSLVRYCVINDPTDWTTTTDTSSGAGFINVSNEVEGSTSFVGMASYEQHTAIFGRNSIVIYDLQADMTQSGIVQPIDNTGTLAPRSIVPYGANDVYYLDETGIRSLRIRSAVDSAYASDVGSAIDPFIHDIIAEVGTSTVAKASAAIEAVDGRYMLALGQYVVILSQFPSSNIVAWSYIDFGETIDEIVRVNRTIYARAGDTIYAYGGINGDVYPDDDEFDILAETPFISSKDPAGMKHLQGFDFAAENTWRVQVLPDPNDPEHFIDVGYINGTTYHLPAYKAPGRTSHFALRMTCSSAGYATISSTAVHASTGEKQ